MKLIRLNNETFTQVDDWNYEQLNKLKWFLYKDRNGIKYAVYRFSLNGKDKYIRMHRLITNAPKDKEVDHADHDGLNNQEYNLRVCTHSQNQSNRKKVFGNCKYLGVCIETRKYKTSIYIRIKAFIHSQGKKIYLGSFPTQEAAALAYNEAAIKYHGEFANLNIIK